MIFDRAQRAEEIGAQLVIEKGEVVALALCLDGTSIYAIPAVGFLTGQYLAEELERLMEVVPSVTVLDLKVQLPFLKNHSRFYDHFTDTIIIFPDILQLIEWLYELNCCLINLIRL